MSKRVTGVGIYRTVDEDNDYDLVEIIKLNEDEWYYNTENNDYRHHLVDKGTIIDYTTWAGIAHDAKNVSKMHYGLSASYKGYMFISDVWHPDLKDTKRYIYISQLFNFSDGHRYEKLLMIF